MSKKDKDLVIVDVVISDIGQIPPVYFLNGEVIDTLRAVIRTDVVLKGAGVPPGCEPIYGPPKGTSMAAVVKVAVARNNLWRALLRELPALMLFVFVGMLGIVFYLILRGL